MMKLIDLINKDVKAENESKKVMVALRVLYLIVAVAFLLDMILVGGHNFRIYWRGFCGFYAALIILFIYTYYSKTRISLWLFLLYVFSWSLYMIPKVGWSAGMQNFFILVLLMVFFGSYAGLGVKLILAAIVLAARVVVILTLGGVKPVGEISWLTDKLLQIVNISAVFSAIIYVSYTFSKAEKEHEGKLVEYNDRLRKEAYTDQLTGLYNRRRAKDYLADLNDSDTVSTISLAIGDIDFFKKVNDTYGHDSGDEVLKKMAEIMTASMRSNTFIARWGGEEFLIVFPDCNGDEAHIALERLRRTIQNTTITVGGQQINVTMTFGLAEYDYSGDFEKSIKAADDNLYRGKENGRNQVVY